MEFDLGNIKNEKDLKNLFIENLNWERFDIPELLDFSSDIKEKINNYRIIAKKLDYKIFFFDLINVQKPEKELKLIERKIINNSQLKRDVENSIFVFSANGFEYLDFVKAEKVAYQLRLKIFSISPDNRNKLRTPSEQLAKLKLDPENITASYIKNKIEEAFSVEVVTEKFYERYIDIFQKIKKSLLSQKVEICEKEKEDIIRDFIHKILNRIMFLYFVQRRGCFGGDKNFLANFWDAYKNTFKGEDKFHKEWLNTLFFKALSEPSGSYQRISSLGKFNEILKNAPYLNGGLFKKDEKLDNIGWYIPDDLFDDIFEFFESYNFTIEESTPFYVEIAINPEMLGNIYEHLVNVEEREEQAKAGIFYTPKVEIELMIRRAMVEFLFNKTKIDKEKLYEFVFPEIGEEIDIPFTKEEAAKILKELEEIFILDSACGSGHYLVVTAQILYELKDKLWKKLGNPPLDKYEEKKKIIERNIYGNDIKKWAVEVAKLRLWLDLFVDAKEEALENQIEPLLPNLNFKIRYGDSLVQKIGANLIALRRISSVFKYESSQLNDLQKDKLKVYENKLDFKTALNLERNLLGRVLFRLHHEIFEEIKRKKRQIKVTEQPNILFQKEEGIIDKKTLNELKKEQEKLEKELKEIDKLKDQLSKMEEPPMIWDLAFAEVFRLKKGFDIVIANPPYVRQELIEDLTGFYSKKEYKEKLIQQIKQDWSYDYNGKPIKSPIPEQFDKKCDLYVYFYLKGLKLLNPNGVLCYISSNSWLDVGFGRVLQEVLLKRCPITAIYDNQTKRSFKHADINTIIAIIKAPKTQDFDKEIKENNIQFIMFKKPFDEVMYSEILIDLEKNETLKQLSEGKRRENEIYSLHIVNQKDLYELGRDKRTGKYTGNKWGGKYLRAPEIYWIILEKGKELLVHLEDIANIEGYIHGFNVGKKFPRVHFIESLEMAKTIHLYENSEGVISYGVKNEGNSRVLGDLLFPRMIGGRYLVLITKWKVYGQKFYKIIFKNKEIKEISGLFLNSTVGILQAEINLLSPWGLGALSANSRDIKKLYTIMSLKIPDKVKNSFGNREIKSIFQELGFDPSKSIREQEPNPLPDRKALDDIVFDALGLTEEERKEVYWAVAELVKNRLEKAKSV